MRGSVRAGLCLLILIICWSNVSRMATAPLDQGKPEGSRAVLGVHAWPSHGAHSAHPMADDGLTPFSPQLRTVEIIPPSSFLPAHTHVPAPAAEKDLLSLTQRRRE